MIKTAPIVRIDKCTEENVDAADHHHSVPKENIVFPTKIIRGKNERIRLTSKGTLSQSTKAMNIVHASRGPTSISKNIFDHAQIFYLFKAEEIIKGNCYMDQCRSDNSTTKYIKNNSDS